MPTSPVPRPRRRRAVAALVTRLFRPPAERRRLPRMPTSDRLRRDIGLLPLAHPDATAAGIGLPIGHLPPAPSTGNRR